MKRFLSFAIFSALAVQLCGCSGTDRTVPDESSTLSETASASSEAAGGTEAAEDDSVPPMDTSPLTLTLFINDTDSGVSFDNEAAEEIRLRTGITLEIAVAENENSLDELIASGNVPDLLYAGEDTDKHIESGLLIPMTNLPKSTAGTFPRCTGTSLTG